VTEGPGEDESGRRHDSAQVAGQAPKQAEALRVSPFRMAALGYAVRAIGVTGGVAWTKRPTTLTGESPTSSPAGNGPAAGTPTYKSQTKGAADARERGGRLIRRALRMAALPE